VALVYAGTVLGSNWTQIRDTLRPFDTLIILACVAAVIAFVVWRIVQIRSSGGGTEAEA
jgi:membrane protein DedA with SNARE-associated domain